LLAGQTLSGVPQVSDFRLLAKMATSSA